MSAPTATPAIDFYLVSLDSSIDLSSATIQAADAPDLDPSGVKAVAHLWLDASAVRSVFQFATNAADLTDVSAEDLYFFVDASGFADLSANNKSSTSIDAAITEGTISGLLKEQIGLAYVAKDTKNSARSYKTDPAGIDYAADNKGLIKDLFRDCAHQLFGTQYGVDIFNNEKDLCNNTATSLKSLFQDGGSIYDALQAADSVNNGTDTSANIGFVLFKAIVQHDKERLQDVSGSTSIFVSDVSLNLNANTPGAGSNSSNIVMRKYKMPLLVGDTLRFHINCNFAATQHDVVGKATALEDRKYEIVLHLE